MTRIIGETEDLMLQMNSIKTETSIWLPGIYLKAAANLTSKLLPNKVSVKVPSVTVVSFIGVIV